MLFFYSPKVADTKKWKDWKLEGEVTAVKKGKGETKQIRPDAAENEWIWWNSNRNYQKRRKWFLKN